MNSFLFFLPISIYTLVGLLRLFKWKKWRSDEMKKWRNEEIEEMKK